MYCRQCRYKLREPDQSRCMKALPGEQHCWSNHCQHECSGPVQCHDAQSARRPQPRGRLLHREREAHLSCPHSNEASESDARGERFPRLLATANYCLTAPFQNPLHSPHDFRQAPRLQEDIAGSPPVAEPVESRVDPPHAGEARDPPVLLEVTPPPKAPQRLLHGLRSRHTTAPQGADLSLPVGSKGSSKPRGTGVVQRQGLVEGLHLRPDAPLVWAKEDGMPSSRQPAPGHTKSSRRRSAFSPVRQ